MWAEDGTRDTRQMSVCFLPTVPSISNWAYIYAWQPHRAPAASLASHTFYASSTLCGPPLHRLLMKNLRSTLPLASSSPSPPPALTPLTQESLDKGAQVAVLTEMPSPPGEQPAGGIESAIPQ